MVLHPISGASFTLVSNGFVDSPAQAVRDFLIERSARRVTTIFHPLLPDEPGRHEITIFEEGKVSSQTVKLPFRPPWTYVLDPVVPLRISPSNLWIGFNNLATLRGIVARGLGRVEKTCYWAIDFTPKRFGDSPLSAAYRGLDGLVCRKVDLRVELSDEARRGREGTVKGRPLAPSRVVPMGVWLDRVPNTNIENWRTGKIVYMGHLVERQGVPIFLRAVHELVAKGRKVEAVIVGRGPQEDELRELTRELGIEELTTFHGFVEHTKLESILSECAIGVAPYLRSSDSFTRYADPGKLKSYLAAGLPIVMTDVPPNASELEDVGAATVVDDSPAAVAQAIDRLLSNESAWRSSRDASLAYAKRFDWNDLIGGVLADLGFG